MVFQIDGEARDVGITCTAGIKRPNKLVKNRFQKRKHRFGLIRKIAKISRKARKLYTGSGFSAATWGHQGSSLSDSHMIELERDALACTGIKPAGRCRAIGLFVAFGLQGTPRSRIVRETVKAWFELLRQLNSKLLGDLKKAWNKAREK